MGCKKTSAPKKAKTGHFQCSNCDVVRKKKKHLCEPKKIKKKST